MPKPGKDPALRLCHQDADQRILAGRRGGGAKSEAAKYGIKLDVQAAKDESSMVEQLNLAQTVVSQKPDALLLSPQSDSNLVPVIKAAQAPPTSRP